MREDIKYGNEATVTSIGDKLGKPREFAETFADYRARLIGFLDRNEGGGPAFGEFHKAGDCEAKQGGMTLRDYFAAKALGFASVDPNVLAFTISAGPAVSAPIIAEHAYRIADAMLAERAK